MKEEYLHSIWRLKRLNFSNLRLTDGRKIEILNTGLLNSQSGPDFFNGKIRIDKLTWVGNIEMHLKSSDWYLHNHHLDSSYNNVILHVVYEYNKDVYIGGKEIPTLELKSMIDEIHFEKYSSLILKNSWVSCEKLICEVPKEIVYNQIETALIDRLERKNQLINLKHERLNKDVLGLYYEIYAQAFGLKVNALSMIELCKRIDLKLLWKINKFDALSIVFGVAGFLNFPKKYKLQEYEKNWVYLKMKYELSEMDFSSWKFFGLRPQSFPDNKLKQFVDLVTNKDFFNFQSMNEYQILNLFSDLNFTLSFRNNVIINAVIPILFWNYKYFENDNYREIAMNLLTNLSAESNVIIERWRKIGIFSKSSFDSQGLLELKNELCDKKKCLSCKIGYTILKN